MKLSVETREPVEVRADALILGRYAGETRPGPALAAIDEKVGGMLSAAMAAEKFEGKPGQVSQLFAGDRLRSPRVLVVGLGPRRGGGAEAVRRAASTGARRARDLGAASIAVAMPPDGLDARARAQAIVEGALLGTYRF